MEKVVVHLHQWGRGANGGYLRRRDTGECCILGFACLSAGMPWHELDGNTVPTDLSWEGKHKPHWMFNEKGDDSVMVSTLITINDVPLCHTYALSFIPAAQMLFQRAGITQPVFIKTDEDRKTFITKLLATVGVEVEFKENDNANH